jgi:hypothetical protein
VISAIAEPTCFPKAGFSNVKEAAIVIDLKQSPEVLKMCVSFY